MLIMLKHRASCFELIYFYANYSTWSIFYMQIHHLFCNEILMSKQKVIMFRNPYNVIVFYR